MQIQIKSCTQMPISDWLRYICVIFVCFRFIGVVYNPSELERNIIDTDVPVSDWLRYVCVFYFVSGL